MLGYKCFVAEWSDDLMKEIRNLLAGEIKAE